MSQNNPALQLLNDIWADINDPNFIWQVLALLFCLGGAYLFARFWHGRHQEGAGRLSDAGARLVFPVTGMVLVGVARLALKPFFHVNLLKLALPLLGSMALVRSVIFVLRQAFPRAAWLSAWERIIAAVVWGWLALYITDVAPYVIDSLEQVEFAIGKQRINLWMILHGIVTVFLTVVLALWIAGLIEAKLMRLDRLDSSLRIVGSTPGQGTAHGSRDCDQLVAGRDRHDGAFGFYRCAGCWSGSRLAENCQQLCLRLHHPARSLDQAGQHRPGGGG